MTPRLSQIVDRYRDYCETIPVAAFGVGASEEEVAANRSIIVAGRPVLLDEPYLDLARVVDGIVADGVNLYPIVPRVHSPHNRSTSQRMSIGQANLDWYEACNRPPELADLLIYGHDDTAFFVRHLPSGRFQQRGRVGYRVYSDSATFEDGLWETFRYALELEGASDE
jgi:hypothetical protein